MASDGLYDKFSVSLAPMVRASTLPLRSLALSYGADYVYSEEIVDRSISSTIRVVNDKLNTIDFVKPRAPTKQMPNPTVDDGGVVVFRTAPALERGRVIFQIGTGDAVMALDGAKAVANDVAAIDVNMGCPKKFSTTGGMGSALLKDVGRATDIIKTLRRNLSVPITAKIRLLGERDTPPDTVLKLTLDFMNALSQAGASVITVHARKVSCPSEVLCASSRWPFCRSLVDGCSSSRVVINGDVYSMEDVEEVRREANPAGVMIARGALYNASVFRKEGSLPLKDVAKSYLRECVLWDNHFTNTKYTICEFFSVRRHASPELFWERELHRSKKEDSDTPKRPGGGTEATAAHIQRLLDHLPDRTASHGMTVHEVCKCADTEELCRLWDVEWEKRGGEKQEGGLLQRYEDDYFLKGGEEKGVGTKAGPDDADEKQEKGAVGDGGARKKPKTAETEE